MNWSRGVCVHSRHETVGGPSVTIFTPFSNTSRRFRGAGCLGQRSAGGGGSHRRIAQRTQIAASAGPVCLAAVHQASVWSCVAAQPLPDYHPPLPACAAPDGALDGRLDDDASTCVVLVSRPATRETNWCARQRKRSLHNAMCRQTISLAAPSRHECRVAISLVAVRAELVQGECEVAPRGAGSGRTERQSTSAQPTTVMAAVEL